MKKKVVAAIMSVALVAAVGIGGTLAYLSATSGPVENSFTVGKGFIDDGQHEGLYIDEQAYAYDKAEQDSWKLVGERTESGNRYVNLYPGDSYIKDPTVHMVGGSVESYVFVKVTGVDELEGLTSSSGEKPFNIDEWHTDAWEKVADENGQLLPEGQRGGEGNGIYRYIGSVATNKGSVDVSKEAEGSRVDLPEPVFEEFKVEDATSMPNEGTELSQKVKVSACAVQVGQDTTWEDGFAQAEFHK